jgi:Rrf2 family protein
MVVLGRLPAGEHVGANRVAGEIQAPPNYLGKLLQTLAREGVVFSQKGIGGGFRLARPAKDISLLEIIEPIEHIGRWSGCIIGRSECSDEHPCVVHERWKKVRTSYMSLLQGTTVADLVRSGEGILQLAE